jgi:nuclear transport factor 2 (NTF2) superfamily protein
MVKMTRQPCPFDGAQGRERKYYSPLGRRPDDHPSLSDLGL